MKVSFSGARKLEEHQQRIVVTSLNVLKGSGTNEFTTGACQGVDEFIGRYCAEHFPEAVHRVIVPANRTLICEYGWATEVIEMPEGTDYRERNFRLLDHAEVLLAFPAYTQEDLRSKRSGTWQTIREANRRNITAVVNPLNVENQ